MINRRDFVALIGYAGSSAIVDKRFAAQYGRCDTLELAAMGHYKAALCSAIHSQRPEECQALAEWLHEHGLFTDYDCEGLKALFGVWQVETVESVLRV